MGPVSPFRPPCSPPSFFSHFLTLVCPPILFTFPLPFVCFSYLIFAQCLLKLSWQFCIIFFYDKLNLSSDVLYIIILSLIVVSLYLISLPSFIHCTVWLSLFLLLYSQLFTTRGKHQTRVGLQR